VGSEKELRELLDAAGDARRVIVLGSDEHPIDDSVTPFQLIESMSTKLGDATPPLLSIISSKTRTRHSTSIAASCRCVAGVDCGLCVIVEPLCVTYLLTYLLIITCSGCLGCCDLLLRAT
jgi:hypothetical protein